MLCPLCNYDNTKVTDSRPAADGVSVKRRRECVKCGYRFSTVEEVEILDVTVIKRNGEKERRGLLERRPEERLTLSTKRRGKKKGE